MMNDPPGKLAYATPTTAMTQPTGWHYHVCEGQFVHMLSGLLEISVPADMGTVACDPPEGWPRSA